MRGTGVAVAPRRPAAADRVSVRGGSIAWLSSAWDGSMGTDCSEVPRAGPSGRQTYGSFGRSFWRTGPSGWWTGPSGARAIVRRLMTPTDLAYLIAAIDAGLVHGPCLELGAGIPEHSARSLLVGRGIQYCSTDIAGEVDYVVDFERDDAAEQIGERFATVLVLNVLEHCFEPIRVLDNACKTLQEHGTCVVITPAVWPIHSYPIDCWRLLPDFYRQYAERRRMELVPDWFRYVGASSSDMSALPPPGASELHRLYSRAVHKLLRTSGRGTWTRNHVAIGAILRR